jgi:hypothetical protein
LWNFPNKLPASPVSAWSKYCFNIGSHAWEGVTWNTHSVFALLLQLCMRWLALFGDWYFQERILRIHVQEYLASSVS